MPEFKKSTNKNKKYMVKTPKGKWIHFGQKNYEQYFDGALGLYSHLNHLDPERRRRYLARARGIKNKDGKLTLNDKESPNYYSIKYLW